MYTVYKHTTPSGKVYIGITKRAVEKRWESGSGYKSNKHFYSAIKKYGWDNIKHEIVCTGLNKWQACRVEQSLIKYFDSTNRSKGYNNSTGGEYGALGMHHSIESRRKLSESNKGKHRSQETRRKISEAQKGKKPSAECIRKSIEARKGKHLSAETRRKLSEANMGKPSTWKGKHLSIDTRRKISESLKGTNNPNYGKHPNADTRRKLSEANKGKRLSAETRRKMSEAHKMEIGWNQRAVVCVETEILYSSITEAAKSIGVTRMAISRVLRGITKTSGGYHWKYAD